MIDLLARHMNQRVAFAALALILVTLSLCFGPLESGGYVTILLGLFAAYYGEQAFDRWVAGKEGQKP